MERVFDQVNVIVTPATPLTAFPIGSTKVMLGGKEYDARAASTRFTREFNASGHPTLAIPCGVDSQGLPIGLQIVGRLWDEAAVLHTGYAYEQATDWHMRRPPVS
jgi:aspartyl-tRNA(Asn)/glutamyl-tRNA(Gln) amidotransferase subunit A